MLEVRRKVTEDRLRLGKFQMVRQGGSFVEVWSDGYAFDDLKRYANIVLLCARPTCTCSFSVSMIQIRYCHYSQNLVSRQLSGKITNCRVPFHYKHLKLFMQPFLNHFQEHLFLF